ncbi:MAG: lipocalin-like domain-containing protein [Burkholderiaceae bacterium]
MRRRPFLAALLPAVLPATAAAERESAARLVDRSEPASAPAHASTAMPAPARTDGATRARADAHADATRPSPPGTQAAPDSGPAPSTGITHRPLSFPADHGAHPDTHIEWWYVTGWLRDVDRTGARTGATDAETAPPDFGFQATFFRMRTGLAQDSPSRFAARQLVFAHVALTDLSAGRPPGAPALLHDQRAAREGFGIAVVPAAGGEQVLRLRDWTLARAAGGGVDGRSSHLRIETRCEGFALSLALDGTQPLLLQGEAGYSRKGPRPEQASRYYSEPQLRVRGRVERTGAPARGVEGRAWLDHEWSDQLLAPGAAGWDWIGIDLLDGGALMAFRVRGLDGRPVWAGGSWRDASGALRIFGADEVEFRPLRRWRSPRTQAEYPVEWQVQTPAGRFHVAALHDDQELDSRASTGAVYWEGLSGLHAEDGRLIGWGYLELTGYQERLRL